MAVRKEKVTPKSLPREVIVETTCDICGQSCDWDASDDSRGGWARNVFGVNCVTVSYTFGSRYPEGPDLNEEIFDICPKCWQEHLVPWMAGHGAKPRDKNMDY